MNEFWHDSPTFLNRGDRFMMGLTLPQLLLVGAIGVVWGMMGMIFEGLGFTTALAWVTAGIGLAFSLVMAWCVYRACASRTTARCRCCAGATAPSTGLTAGLWNGMRRG